MLFVAVADKLAPWSRDALFNDFVFCSSSIGFLVGDSIADFDIFNDISLTVVVPERGRRSLDLMFSQKHVGDTITDHVDVLAIWADHLSGSDVGL